MVVQSEKNLNQENFLPVNMRVELRQQGMEIRVYPCN